MNCSPEVFILQRILPDYRAGFYEKLAGSFPKYFVVTSGADRFTDALRSVSVQEEWILPVTNRFWCGNRLLWQSGCIMQSVSAPLLVAELNPRIVSTWLVLAVRRSLRRPSVVWGHSRSLGERIPFIAGLRFWQCRLAGAVLAYTDSQAAEFRAKLPDIAVFVAPNACVSVRDCVAAQSEMPTAVLYVGRLIAEKKVDLLIRAFAMACPKIPPDSKLKVVGDGPDRQRLENLARGSGVASRIEFLGHTTGEAELKNIYAGAACSVSPGYIGLSAMQSLAHGVPMLVSSDEYHSPEIEACVADVTAMFFPSNSVESLSEALIAFFTSQSVWQNKRPEIARFIAEKYSFEAMASGFVAMVSSLAPGICPKKHQAAGQ